MWCREQKSGGLCRQVVSGRGHGGLLECQNVLFLDLYAVLGLLYRSKRC